MLEYTRRRLLGALSGSSLTTLAGCESPLKNRGGEPASSEAVVQETQIDDPYDVTIQNVVASAHEAYFLINIRRRSTETVYTALSPVHIRTRQDVKVHRLVPDMEREVLNQAKVELALGVGAELLNVPDPGFVVDALEVIQDLENQPDHATLAPTATGEAVQYLVWLTSEQSVDDWAKPKTNIWYEFATSGDKTIRRRDLSPLQWLSCGEMPSKTPATPSDQLGEWWNADWQFRREVTVTEQSGQALTDYPLVVTVPHNGNVQADCADVRVVVDGETVPYAVQNCGEETVDIAIRQQVPSSQSRTFSIYYGNADARDQSRAWNTVVWDFYEDFEQYSEDEVLTGTDGWVKAKQANPDLQVEQSAFADDKLALGSTSHSHGVRGWNTRMSSWQYPDMGFLFQAGVNVETDQSLPRVGISTWTEERGDGSGASIHFDSSNDGAGDDDLIDFFFFGDRAVLAGTPTRAAYDAEIVGYPDQTGIGRYRRNDGSWNEAELSTSFEGTLNSVTFQLWKWGGQVDRYRVRRFVDPEPAIDVGSEEQYS